MLLYRRNFFAELGETDEHVFLLPRRDGVSRVAICTEIVEWCLENFGPHERQGRWSTFGNAKMTYFVLKNEDDAVWFRLRWG